eukprot:scaffold4112_cov60-Cylindrotheca_fusiformis.AAC.9
MIKWSKRSLECGNLNFQLLFFFFRWAQRPASHFNSDSISLVKTLALQCQFTPLRLIVDLKNYCFWTTNNRNNYLPFGFRLNFAEDSSGKDRLISAKTATALKGLKYAFSYLQQQVLAEKDSIRGKIGMRDETTKNTPLSLEQQNDDDNSSGPGATVINTHTPEGFEKRVWLELEHRVLAYHIVRMVVHSANSRASFRSKGIDATNILSLSFAALSPCKEHQAFVTVLAHLCLLIDDKDSVKNHPSLNDVWDNRKDRPQALCDASLAMKLPRDEIVQKVNAVFHDLRNKSRSASMSLDEDVHNNTKQWAVIRARVFSIWLKDFTCNAELRDELTNLALQDLGLQTVSGHQNDDDAVAASGSAGTEHGERSRLSSWSGLGRSTIPPLGTNVEMFQQQFTHARSPVEGAVSLVGQWLTRKNPVVEEGEPPSDDNVSITTPEAPVAAPQDNNTSLSHSEDSDEEQRSQECGVGLDRLRAKVSRIRNLRIPGRIEMDTHLQSYLIIYGNVEDYVLQMAPVERRTSPNLQQGTN